MKVILFLSIFIFPLFLFSQTWSTSELSKRMRSQYATNDSVRKINKALLADTTAKGKRIVVLEKTVRMLQDSVKYLTDDFYIDSKKNISIPALKTLDTRVNKLELQKRNK